MHVGHDQPLFGLKMLASDVLLVSGFAELLGLVDVVASASELSLPLLLLPLGFAV